MLRHTKLIGKFKLSILMAIFTICAIDSSGFPASDRVASAQSQPSQKSPTTQPVSSTRNGWLIDKIIGLLRPKTSAGGSRGDGIVCADSPIFKPDNPYLWTRQPVLVWTGNPSAIQLLDAQSQRVVWQKSVARNTGTRQLRIDRLLELGKRYIWRVVAEPNHNAVNPEVAFQMVDPTQWKKIDRELKALEQKQKGQKLNSEEIALERVNYFAQRQMWGDVQETLAVLPATIGQNQEFIDLGNKIREELSQCRQKLE
jgi:hypothetical protein